MDKQELIDYAKENGYIIVKSSSNSGGGGGNNTVSINSLTYKIYRNIMVNGDLNGNISKYSVDVWNNSTDADTVLESGRSYHYSYAYLKDLYKSYIVNDNAIQNNSGSVYLNYFSKSPKTFYLSNKNNQSVRGMLYSPVSNGKTHYIATWIDIKIVSGRTDVTKDYYLHLNVYNYISFRPTFNLAA